VLGEFYCGLELRAREFAYKLEEFWLAEPGMTARRIGDFLRARGINHGHLDRAATWPAVGRGWKALAGRIEPDGAVGYVQQIGQAPDAF
jgi:hypothetical protein